MSNLMLTSEDTHPSMGENHPASLAWNCINNAAQIAEGLKTSGEDGGTIADDGERIVELLNDSGLHVADLVKLLDHNEKTIEEQRLENLRLSSGNRLLLDDMQRMIKEDLDAQREVTRLTHRLQSATSELEHIGRLADEAICFASLIRKGTHELLRDTAGQIVPMGATPTTDNAPAAARGA